MTQTPKPQELMIGFEQHHKEVEQAKSQTALDKDREFLEQVKGLMLRCPIQLHGKVEHCWCEPLELLAKRLVAEIAKLEREVQK